MPVASLIIRCYNEERHIGRLLAGVMAQTIQDREIIVVDSGSTDATLSIASRYPVRIVRIQPGDFSFGRALNVGCDEATGEFIVLASAHTYPVYRDWLERLLAPFTDPKVGLVYGKQRGAETTKFSEHQIFAHWFPEKSVARQSHPFCNNANAAIRRSLWLEEPYNETLTGLEDIDWARRILAKGYWVSYAADAVNVHVHHETSRQTFNRYRREAMALKQIDPNAHFDLWDFVRFFLSNVASDYYHAMQQHLFVHNLVPIPQFRLMQFGGTWRGFREKALTNQLWQTFYYPRDFDRASPLPTRKGRINYSGITEGPQDEQHTDRQSN